MLKSLAILIRVWLVVVLITGWTGCNGSGGGSSDDDNDTISPSTQIQDVAEEVNENATKFITQVILFGSAVEELFEEIETHTSGIDLDGITIAELTNQIGQDQVDILAENCSSIINEKIDPATEAMYDAHADLTRSEEEFENIINSGSEANRVQPAEFFTTGAICAAAGIGISILGTIAYCAEEVQNAKQECIAGRMEDFGETETIATLACTLQLEGTFEKCVKDIALTVYTIGLSIGTDPWKPVQFIIDSISGWDATGKIDRLMGQEGCSTADEFIAPYGYAKNTNLATTSDTNPRLLFAEGSNGNFLLPEGDWTLLLISDDNVRRVSECVNIGGTDETITLHVVMAPIDQAEDLIEDNDGDGYTICQDDCDDTNASIHIGATEICDDDIDNNCNNDTDCSDVECSNNPACESINLSPFNQVSFSLESLFVGDEEPNEPFNHISSLGDYGFDGSVSGNKYTLLNNSETSDDGRWTRTMDPFEIEFDENYNSITKIEYKTTNSDNQSQYEEIYGIETKIGSSVSFDSESSSSSYKIYKVVGMEVCEIVKSFYKDRYRDGEEEPFDYIRHKDCDNGSKLEITFSIR